MTTTESASVVAQTAAGRVRGLALDDILVWRGIPYAQAPTGPLRFRPPQPAQPWPGVRAAAAHGPVAWQPSPAGLAAAEPAPDRSEDCLTVTVSRPAAPPADPAGYPVLVWVHGGGYVQGSGAGGLAGDGAILARRGLVVVTFNYRLGCLGFLHLDGAADAGAGDLSAGQAGFLDQVAAVRWVHANIAGFGGDPRRITAYGVSAGAKSVANLIASPLAAGLISRAISASGGAEHIATVDQATRLRRRFLAELGIRDDDVVRQLRSVPPADLIAAQVAIATGGKGTWVWRPVLGAPGIPQLPITAIAAGAAAGIPLLIGHNSTEGTTYQLLDPTAADQAPGVLAGLFGSDAASEMLAGYHRVRPELDDTGIGVAVLSDERYAVPTYRLALAQSAHAPVWRYRYDSWPPGYPPELAGGHGLDSAAVWRDDEFARAALTGPDARRARLGQAMGAAWARFARGEAPFSAAAAAEPPAGAATAPASDEAPGLLPPWEQFGPDSELTMVLAETPRLEAHPGAAQFALWGDRTWPSGTWWPIAGL